MKNTRDTEKNLDWSEVQPIGKLIYCRYVSSDYLRWPESVWPILSHGGLAKAGTPDDKLESTVLAISLFHFHICFTLSIWHIVYEPDYSHVLDGVVAAPDLGRLAVISYEADKSGIESIAHCTDCALRWLVPHQIAQILHCLRQHFGSMEEVFRSLANYSGFNLDSLDEREFEGLLAAYAYLKDCDVTDTSAARTLH